MYNTVHEPTVSIPPPACSEPKTICPGLQNPSYLRRQEWGKRRFDYGNNAKNTRGNKRLEFVLYYEAVACTIPSRYSRIKYNTSGSITFRSSTSSFLTAFLLLSSTRDTDTSTYLPFRIPLAPIHLSYTLLVGVINHRAAQA